VDEESGRVLIKKIETLGSLALPGVIPEYSFRPYLLPDRQTILRYRKDRYAPAEMKIIPQVLLGMTVVDLKAVNLYDYAFTQDPQYQKRRDKTVLIGLNLVPGREEDYQFVAEGFAEDILEHIPFDIFLQQRASDFKVISGSAKGRHLLEKFGYGAYENIRFAGPVKEKGPDSMVRRLKEQMQNKHNPRIWQELGQRCLDCGKCTIVCPTCFCFRTLDCPSLIKGEGTRERHFDACFYPEFSQIAGGYRFLNNTAKRIHNWYYHKFARIPQEYGFLGCVQCGRCTKTCPVKIDIKKVTSQILKT
jgi:sulfhydrogenase subunit beta (sulfur reductase)